MLRRVTARVVPLVLLVLAATVAGCTRSMLGQSIVADGPLDGCRSSLGAYYLPKTVIGITAVTKGVHGYFKKLPEQRRIADRKAGFCLDYLWSATSNDTISVIRTPATPSTTDRESLTPDSAAAGLLLRITSSADDQSKDIAINFIKALFGGLAGHPFNADLLSVKGRDATDNEPEIIIFDGEYDPADPDEAAAVNQTIAKEARLCLVLEGLVPWRDIDAYCEQPVQYRKRQRAAELAHEGRHQPSKRKALEAGEDSDGGCIPAAVDGGWAPRVSRSLRHHELPSSGLYCALASERARRLPVKAFANGIYYRPPLPHNYFLLQKENRNYPKWKLVAQEILELENASPLIGVAVERTFFVNHKVELDFTLGVLTKAKAVKPSEVLAMVEIPLFIAKSIAALPANIFQLRIDQTANERDLLGAQQTLIDQQIKYLQKLKELEAARQAQAK